MKFQYVSDLHLEFYRGRDVPLVPYNGADVLLLAGDIYVGNETAIQVERIAANGNWKHILFICGNHEFYNNRYDKVIDYLENYEFADDRIVFMNDNYIDLEGVRVLGTTLWTHMEADVKALASYQMNDYQIVGIKKMLYGADGSEIGKRQVKFSPNDSVALHAKAMTFLEGNMSSDTNNVVMSHHAPMFVSDRRYDNSSINTAYSTDLSEFIDKHNISHWVHGHIHTSHDDMIGTTNVLSNPYGYEGREVNPEFDWEKTFAT